MKYCKWCHKVYDDSITKCSCEHGAYYNSELLQIPEDAPEMKCRLCGTTEDLLYTPKFDGILSGLGNYFRCAPCTAKIDADVKRENNMKYALINNEEGKAIFFENKNELEDYFSKEVENIYISSADYDTKELEMFVILKLEEFDFNKNNLSPKDFKTPKNRHLFIYEGEVYYIEGAFTPSIQFDGEYYIVF